MTWVSVPLGDVTTIDRQGISPAQIQDGTAYVGLENVERGGRITGHQLIGKVHVKSNKFRFTREHILYGKLRPNLAKVARPSFEGVCSTDILPVLPSSRIDRNYLAHYLSQQSTVDFATSRASGANLPRLNPSELARFQIPLPPIEEQRRIAAILDQADALRAKRRGCMRELDTIAQSLLVKTFGEPASWPSRWTMGTIGEMADSVKYGTSSRAHPTGSWPILRMGNVTDSGRLDTTDLKYIDLSPAEVPKYTVRRGDLLFNRANSREKVGKCAVVNTDEQFALAGYLVRVRMRPEQPQRASERLPEQFSWAGREEADGKTCRESGEH